MSNGQPPLPRDWRKVPVGNITRVKREQRRMRGFYRSLRAWLRDTIDSIPTQQISANAAGITVNRYEYLIDPAELRRIIDDLGRRYGEVPDEALWRAVRAAYENGTGDEVANLGAITSEYTRTVTQVLQSEPWQRRVALLRARVFEDIEGISAEGLAELRGILSRGIEDGLNPMQLKRTLAKRVGVQASRAERLARTEITTAYRRARWDEDEDANQRLGIRTGLLWLSGFLPDTRPHHAALHGEVVSQEFVREFYTDSSNSVNCVCSQVSVLLDDDGEVLTPGVVERVKSAAPATQGEPIANAKHCACC